MKLTFPQAINTHCHTRQDRFAKDLVKFASKFYHACLVMPNLQPSITTGAQALEYKRHLESTCGEMHIIASIKITEDTAPQMIIEAVNGGVIFGKVYPRGRTTHADDGVRLYHKLWPVFDQMQDMGMTAMFHPTHPSKTFEDKDAEWAFVPIFQMIREAFPRLRMTWEHLTDGRVIEHLVAMQQEHDNVYATITAHHLFGIADDNFGDVRSVCQPPIRHRDDRTKLRELVMQGYHWVMAGLDDAPHPIGDKHVMSGCCKCGAYTTEAAIPLYATALHEAGLFNFPKGEEIFSRFVSENGANYLGVPPPKGTVTIVDEPWTVPQFYDFDDKRVLAFAGGKILPFSYAR